MQLHQIKAAGPRKKSIPALKQKYPNIYDNSNHKMARAKLGPSVKLD